MCQKNWSDVSRLNETYSLLTIAEAGMPYATVTANRPGEGIELTFVEV